MKYVLIIVYLLLPISDFAQSKTDSTFYFSYEQSNAKGDPGKFPTITATSSEIKAALSAYAYYPKFAKSKFIIRMVKVGVTIDERGSITESNVVNPMFPMFDTVALSLVNATGKLWQPAKEKGKAIRSTITIPVFFNIVLDSNIHFARFIVSMFADELPLSIDSTDTFPMSIHGVDSNKKKITNHQFTYIRISPFGKCITKRLLDQTSLNPVYGTVRIGFNLSKDRIMSDIHLVHSLSKLYDNCSLLYLKNLGKQIEPAHENGQLVYSYSEIDFKYDDFGVYQYQSHRWAKNSLLAKEKANEYISNKEYDKALPYLMKAHNCDLDDIILMYQIAFVNFKTGKNEAGCDYLSRLVSTAIDTGYPSSISEEDINSLLKSYCGIGE